MTIYEVASREHKVALIVAALLRARVSADSLRAVGPADDEFWGVVEAAAGVKKSSQVTRAQVMAVLGARPVSTMLESRNHARQVHTILHRAWWEAYRATNGGVKGDIESFRTIKSALDRVIQEAEERFGSDLGHPGCKTCRNVSVFGGPSHDASPNCRSGRHSHCSCDTCF